MTTPEDLEQRIAVLEERLDRLDQRQTPDIPSMAPASLPWWNQVFGSFRDNPEFDEAMRLRRAYRESLRPTAIYPSKYQKNPEEGTLVSGAAIDCE